MTTTHRQHNVNIASNWRTIARTDPREAHEIWTARHAQGTEDYLTGTITRATFAGVLYALDFRGSGLASELAFYDRKRLEGGHAL